MKTRNAANFFTPAITVFDEQGNLDLQGNQRMWDHLIRGGVSGIIPMGSIGEFYAMSHGEKLQLIDLATDYIGGRTKLYIGTSCMTVEETVELSNYALRKGADGVMVIGPYYFSMGEADIEFYYDQVASQVDGPLFLYNFPDRNGYDLSPGVTLNLLRKHKNIVGYKDTLGNMGHTRSLLQTIREEFPDVMVLSGFDEFFAHNILSGGNGCIGGLSNAFPEVFAAWIAAMDEGNLERVFQIQGLVDYMMGIYDIHVPFIPTIKKAVQLAGVDIAPVCKKPFQAIGESETAILKTFMEHVAEQKKIIGI